MPSDLEIQTAAMMFANGEGLKTIADTLGKNSVQAAEYLLELAENKGWLYRRPRFMRERLSSGELFAVEQKAKLEARLRDKLSNPALREIRVVFGNKLDEFARGAANHVYHYLMRSGTIGVAWGTEVSAVAEAVCRIHRGPNRRPAKIFFPVRGDPMGLHGAGDSELWAQSPTAISGRLHRAFNKKDCAFRLGLGGVPAMIPKLTGDPDENRRILDEVYGALEAYREIASGSSPLLGRAEAFLTSVGKFEATNPWTIQCLSAGRTSEDPPLGDVLVGDVAGVPLAIEGRESAAAAVGRQWLGLSEDHLRACAQRSADGDARAGVVVCACQAFKAEPVLRAVELSLVSRLVLSNGLARRMCSVLGCG